MTEVRPDDKCAKRLFLIDGSALAYRSHFAFIRSPLSNAAGLSTGGIFGFTRALKQILEEADPSHIALVFDHKGPTFRHELYKEYKATRQKMPEDMREQIPWMKKVTEGFRVPLIELPGFEADDVIGTLARRADAEGFEVMIVSGDKDFMQLVTDRTKLYNIAKANVAVEIVGEEAVHAKFGVKPDLVVDVLALMGDSSDNVPGVSGVGEKTAIKLINEWGSFDEVFAHVDEIKRKKLRETLTLERDIAELSRRLVTIDTDVKLDHDVASLARQEPDTDALKEIYREMEFGRLLAELSQGGAAADPVEKDYRIVRSEAELEALIDLLKTAGTFVLDLETTGLDKIDARIVGFSFSTATGEGHYVAMNLDPPLLPGDWEGSALVERLRPLLESDKFEKCGQNIKYDASVLVNHDIELGNIAFDTMIASYLLDPGSREHSLDGLSLRHFDYKKIKTEEIIGSKGDDQLTMNLVPIETVGEYACEDADFTWRLYELFAPRLLANELRELFDTIEMPLVPVLLRMERQGVRLKKEVLAELGKEIQAELATLEDQIYELAGREFNIASPKQLSEILFVELKLHEKLGVKPKKTKTGFSTNHEVLDSMQGHDLPRRILEYRGLAKLLNTYVLTLPKLVHPSTGRIHTQFNQAVAATGRLSSSDPNLQNIPIRTPRGRRIREAFVPSNDGWVLLAADYSQIELRIMAHVSQDPQLIAAFERGADIHRETAARVFEVEPEAVDSEMRSRAKSINFGIMYGMGSQRLARETGMSVAEATAFIDRYFDSFPTVRNFLESCKERARQDGYVTTLFGRRRPIPDIQSSNGRLRSAAENMAVNTPIQGSAADLIKLAMIEIDAYIRRKGLKGRMILQVHDELVFDLPRDELELFRDKMPALMASATKLRVPLVVETGYGENWSEAH
ncbi:MAG: DNA polymerase I [Planctomycetota bacterium]